MRIKFVIQDSRIDSIEIELILVILILLEDLFLPINPILKDARRKVVVQLGSPYLTKEFLERIPVGYFLIFIRCDFIELCLEIQCLEFALSQYDFVEILLAHEPELLETMGEMFFKLSIDIPTPTVSLVLLESLEQLLEDFIKI